MIELTSTPGFVYLAKSQDGLYKIGSSIAPDKRVKTQGLNLIHTMQTDRRKIAEFRLHKEHGIKWVRGEYFCLTDTDVDTLRQVDKIKVGFSVGEYALAEAARSFEVSGSDVRWQCGDNGFSADFDGFIRRDGRLYTPEHFSDASGQLVRAVKQLRAEGVSVQVFWSAYETDRHLYLSTKVAERFAYDKANAAYQEQRNASPKSEPEPA